MKIIIKLPINEKGKFKLQSRGNLKGKRFKTGIGLLKSLESALSFRRLEEKPSIIVKQYIDSHFTNINETTPSNNKEYLIYAVTCFLEDYLSTGHMRKAEKRWERYVIKMGGIYES